MTSHSTEEKKLLGELNNYTPKDDKRLIFVLRAYVCHITNIIYWLKIMTFFCRFKFFFKHIRTSICFQLVFMHTLFRECNVCSSHAFIHFIL